MYYKYIFKTMYQTVNTEGIAELVDAFYAKVRRDPLLGPIFVRAIGDEWDQHLSKMREFWASVLLASKTYKGSPMIAHLQLPRLMQNHFDRWLVLWRETTSELCSPDVASLYVQKAEMIGRRLLHEISGYHESLASRNASEELRTI
jgi:hemoglobin